MPVLDSPLLQATLRDELRAAWGTLCRAHGQDGLYGFGVYTTDSATYLSVAAFSEKGLDDVVARYVADFSEGGRSADLRRSSLERGGKPDDPALLRRMLRWSPCDSPLHKLGSALLPKSDQIVRELDFEGRWADDADMDDDEFEEACETPDPEVEEVFRLIVQELKGLDAEGVFGTGAERERIVLSVWEGDQSNLDRHAYAKLLNPAAVAARFGREMNDALQAGDEAWYGGQRGLEPDVFV